MSCKWTNVRVILGFFDRNLSSKFGILSLKVQGMRTDEKMSRPRIMPEASRIWREEGLRAFWKGNGVTIVHRLPYSSVNFYAYEEYKMVRDLSV